MTGVNSREMNTFLTLVVGYLLGSAVAKTVEFVRDLRDKGDYEFLHHLNEEDWREMIHNFSSQDFFGDDEEDDDFKAGHI